ncbi:hypothetical protein O6H91_21G015100 [Diphasiastrum complanatum]|uniref:Uncharacterized protein n=1 Tax=Diphasiastrum complanatum TaxID=34168 RepID=A0ACC2AID2_DIPCM|nr:hypothetical protein O6H91_21G015100 [Diphasiastrum complanatum]
MLRTSVKRLRPLLPKVIRQNRWINITAVQRQAVPAVVQQSTKGGFISWFFSDDPNTPPLYEPLPGAKLPPALPDSVEPSETKITTLANGLRIASEEISGSTTTVGIYIDSGSVYENPTYYGASHLLERMAFKSTKNRSHLRLVREVEAIGANIAASASREQMAYTGDSIRTYMPHMVELLVDTVRNPIFYDWEVKEQIHKVKEELAEIANNPQSVLLEALHSAGFTGGLAKPLLATESSLSRLDSHTLESFMLENYTAPRIVLAASGVDHEELVSVADSLLSDLPAVSPPSPPVSEYVGGDWRGQADSPNTHVALAFEVPGGWRNDKQAIAATVLQSLLGGGGSFSSGGPGKGLYSRLYTRVLNQYQQVQSCTAFSSVYNDTGIFGIHATAGSDFVPQLVDIATNELLAVATYGKVTDAELQRAKNTTISGVLMNLEARVVVTEDIGRQMLTYGKRKPVGGFVKAINALTLKDIAMAAESIVATPLTMASWGDVVHVPRYEQVASRFRQNQ